MTISLSKFPDVRPGLQGKGRAAGNSQLGTWDQKSSPGEGQGSEARFGQGQGQRWRRGSQRRPREGLGLEVKAHLRLRERGRRWGERPPSSSATLSELRKCLDRKHSSSGVGWKGSWWRRSREDELDWQEGVSGPRVHGQRQSQNPNITRQGLGCLLVITLLPASYGFLKSPSLMPPPPATSPPAP